jgi:deglycase
MARIAIPLGEGYEDAEFSLPVERLREAGHDVVVVGSRADEELTGKRGRTRARTDAAPTDVAAEDGRPLAAVCHGPQLLIEAGVVRGRTVTSWPSIRTDLENAGATWIDDQVVEDESLITSRKPGDLDAFCKAFLERLA